jgi:putative selenate reductase
MAELIPAPFEDLVKRLYVEPGLQDRLFELPRRQWFRHRAESPDLSVDLHGHRAGNPLGPAAGPHTQMAQNILLSYVAGARICELKTVQVNDRLDIPRPCIDMTNVGYNVEWSQELRIAESVREYVAGMMLVHMFRYAFDDVGTEFAGAAGDVLYDLSVGYDLAGISGPAVGSFLEQMRDCTQTIETLRQQIPKKYSAARDLDYPTCISDSITLSTFHGCPADEIEKICEHLISTHAFDVIVKMNPPMLGKERLEHLLHDELGYTAITVNPDAYTSGLAFDEAVSLCERLEAFASRHGRRFGCKFSNTLEVLNHRDFFTADNKVQYLSGQPLHVITMTLTDVFRQAVGPDVPISFSAGIDAQNFPLAVACGFVPITISTDLLRPGGYARLGKCLARLEKEMVRVGAATIDEFIIKCFGETGVVRDATELPGVGQRNTTRVAELVRNDPRYHADRNGKIPPRIDSHLETFDCITCDKCLPVCPNAANFTYPTPAVDISVEDVIVAPDGSLSSGPARQFQIEQRMQIACYADFCNECGNCDTFCPEYGGPYIQKPSFFGSQESWSAAAPGDGFYVSVAKSLRMINGRIKGTPYLLTHGEGADWATFVDDAVEAQVDLAKARVKHVTIPNKLTAPHTLDLHICLTLWHLLEGVLINKYINQVNAGIHA